MNEKIATSPKSKETSEDLAKSVLAFKETLFEPNAFFTHHPIVLSNFRFVWRNDGWLLDGLQMTDSKEVVKATLKKLAFEILSKLQLKIFVAGN